MTKGEILRAIRAHCLDCCCDQPAEVKMCGCPKGGNEMSEILELVDRLVAMSNRAALAEYLLDVAKETIESNTKEMETATETLKKAKEEILALTEEMKKEKESHTRSINYWADRANKFEAELKALKEEKDGSLGEN